MTQGILILTTVDGQKKFVRPKTKKALKIAIKKNPKNVFLERTAHLTFGSDVEFEGKILEMTEGETIYIVGPDPRNSRKWFANLNRSGTKFKLE